MNCCGTNWHSSVLDDAEEILLDHTDVTEHTLALVEGIWGYNMDTLCDVLFYETGYRDFDEFINDWLTF